MAREARRGALQTAPFGEAARGIPEEKLLPQNAGGYRDPDAIHGGTWEALERVL